MWKKLKHKALEIFRIMLPSIVFVALFQPVYTLGPSMQPTIYAGDVGLLSRWSTPQVGDIVCARMPGKEDTIIVKRVAAGPTEGLEGYFLVGDNADNSLDSRYFGEVSQDDIIGVLILHIPTGRAMSAISSIAHPTAASPALGRRG